MFLQNYAKPTTNFAARDMERQREFVEKYMRTADVPEWYRGLSSFQFQAAKNLHNAIRDDLEQGTSHRVREVLNSIGLRPPVSKKRLRLLMRLSRGCDLAFLWFLKDLHYQSDGPGYNTNEQLILSCIAYLDIIFTIRGLDEILPPEQPPKKRPHRMSNEQRRLSVQSKYKMYDKQTYLSAQRKIGSFNKQYKLPYLEHQRRPGPYGKSLSAYPPENVLRLDFLNRYKDPTYVIPNESNRWFSNYLPSEGRQTANTLVNESLNTIFNVTKLPSQVFEAQIFKNLKLSGNEGRKAERQLCEHHKLMEEMEKCLELELRVIAQEKCRKYFDADMPKKELRIARLRKQIENDVNLHLKRFRHLGEKCRSELLLWSKENLHECCLNSDTNSTGNGSCDTLKYNNRMKKKPQNKYTKSESHIERKHKNFYNSEMQLNTESECKLRVKNLENLSAPEIIGDGFNNNKRREKRNFHCKKQPLTEKFISNSTCECKPNVHNTDSTYDYIQNYDYGHSDAKSDTKIFFNAPHKHTPFKFDYQKIFDLPCDEENVNLKRIFVKAIESEEYLRKLNTESKENVDAAIQNYTAKVLREKIKEKLNEVVQKPLIPSAKPHIKYYDPNNKTLMHRMLKEGLEILAKDTRYVLASLPEAHKLPVLRYWIYQRYGKVYTKKEMVKIFKNSTTLFRALLHMPIHETLPSPYDLGRSVFINYRCHDYLMRKSDNIRKLFYDRVDKAIMQQSRHLYIAMTPYIYAGRSPNKTIFAYLPSHPSDIQHFRVWSSRNMRLKRKSSNLNLRSTARY